MSIKSIRASLYLSTIVLLAFVGCSSAEPPKNMMVQELTAATPNPADIKNYEDCVAAGNITTRSFPPRCVTADGRSFVQGQGAVEGPDGVPIDHAAGSPGSFESCIAAGFPIRRTLPATCADASGNVYTEGRTGVTHVEHPLVPAPESAGKICKDLCGDGTCQEIVCMAIGCPCPESPSTCPKDCNP